MRSLTRFLAVLSLSAFAFLTIPATQAATIGDAFSGTFTSQNFSYDAKAELQFGKGGKSELPFDLGITIQEQGGGKDGNFGGDGVFNLNVSNINDVPAEWGDFHSFGGFLKYRSSMIKAGNVSYAEITDLRLSADGREVMMITEMVNEFAKFVTGRTFRFSGDEVAKMLRSEPMMPEQQAFLNALTAGKSLDEVVMATGKLLDGLIASGVLNDEVTTHRNTRSISSMGSETHTLTFADSITPEGAKMLQEALMNFARTMFPGLTGEFEVLGMDTPESIAADLNEFLRMSQQVGFSMTFGLNESTLQSVSFDLDLKGVGVPLTFNERITFDYSTGYQVFMPSANSTIVDVNNIFEGIEAMNGNSGLNSDFPPNQEWDPGVDTAKPGSYELFINIQNACPDYSDKRCAKREARVQLNWVRNQYLRKEFARLKRELNSMINQFYYN